MIVRPDAYVAATIAAATPDAVAAAMRDALGMDERARLAAGGMSTSARPVMRTDANMADPDGFYEAWVAAHEGLSDEESNDLDARLVLLLANQVGDPQVLLACIAEAREQGRQRT